MKKLKIVVTMILTAIIANAVKNLIYVEGEGAWLCWVSVLATLIALGQLIPAPQPKAQDNC